MKKETEVSAKTVEAAVEKGAQALGVDKSLVGFEVLTEPKKGFLGIGEVLAKVKVFYEPSPREIALSFVRTLTKNMGLDCTFDLSETEDGILISINGGNCAALIGHHGETLDQLQYLVNLAANKKEEGEDRNYTKISVDVQDYRAKREETLRALARRMASKVLKYRKNVALEPMSAYERRIIHSEIQNIDGVTTNSVGQENNRRVIIIYERK